MVSPPLRRSNSLQNGVLVVPFGRVDDSAARRDDQVRRDGLDPIGSRGLLAADCHGELSVVAANESADLTRRIVEVDGDDIRAVAELAVERNEPRILLGTGPSPDAEEIQNYRAVVAEGTQTQYPMADCVDADLRSPVASFRQSRC